MKRLKTIIFMAICISLLIPNTVYAIDSQPSNLTVVIKYGEVPLSGLNIAICRVADVREDNGNFVYNVTPTFSGANADFLNLTKEKNIALAARLDTYAYTHGIARDSGLTNGSGNVKFNGLPAGLYLVAQQNSENSEYTIVPYLVSVPSSSESGGFDRNVISHPKTEPAKRNTETVSVSVYKIWEGTDSPPGSISVQLYQNGIVYGTVVTLSADNYWRYTWDKLNPNDIWTVDEFDVAEGYVKTIAGDVASGFIITNTKTTPHPEKLMISGKKVWDHKDNPENKRPPSIVLKVQADGVTVMQKEISEAEHWSWSIRVDKYAENGREIVYTVNEERIYDYSKKVDGFTIYNNYKPGWNTDIPDNDPPIDDPKDPDDPGNPDGPKTNDDSNAALWIGLLGVGLIGLLSTGYAGFCVFKRKKRAKTD